MIDLAHLRSAPLDELEQIYRTSCEGETPRGCYRGQVLRHLDNRGARRPLVVAADWLLFDQPPFGVDFEHRRWWFIHPRLRAGHFTATPGPSRWRPTETLRLDYSVSRLPSPIRHILYDEVKPLPGGICLGLGGLAEDTGEGDHFFFSLSPL